jgi:hypothetical protein
VVFGMHLLCPIWNATNTGKKILWASIYTPRLSRACPLTKTYKDQCSTESMLLARVRLVGRILSKQPSGCKNLMFGFLGAACLVAGTLLKAFLGQARWICPNRSFSSAVRKVKTACGRLTRDSGRNRNRRMCITFSFGSPPSKRPPFSTSLLGNPANQNLQLMWPISGALRLVPPAKCSADCPPHFFFI